MELLYYFIFCFSILFLLSKLLLQKKKHSPPSPTALPIIGHLHLFKKSLHRTLEALAGQYGPILSLQFGFRSVLVVSTPSAIEECFTKNDTILANRPYCFAGEHLAYNYTAFIWSPYGHHWSILRRITNVEIFSSDSLKTSSIIRNKEITHLVRQLYRGSDVGKLQKVELKSLFLQLTLNITMGLVTGKRLFGDKEVNVELREKYLEILREQPASQTMFMSMLDFLPFLRWVGFVGEEKKIIRFHRKRDAFLQGLIDDRRRRRSNFSQKIKEGERKKTLVDALLCLQEAEPEYYPDDIIKGVILVLFTAGIDTSALTLEWAMSLLLNHPEALKKAREEIDNNVEQGRLIEDSDLAKLPYLRCIINETLRLFPVAPLLLPHVSSKECSIGGYAVHPGTILLVNAWAVHRDPKIWFESTSFKPERFEGIEGEREGFKFIPFGLGRRMCPGAGMGIRVVSLALGALLQCFEWGRVGPEKVDMSEDPGLTIPKAKPLEAMYMPRPSMISLCTQL
ncbi:cytochrome P450 81Q32-like [Macadamia integrifolia]|uniref:cytochrome P450 81Q32-like n=1 Tax=Macadamia integrifolia TaxID=60698 RepID=UPI001C500829|nr:cytochrome P450 81Q32-like [Macadamia integrifolia]